MAYNYDEFVKILKQKCNDPQRSLAQEGDVKCPICGCALKPFDELVALIPITDNPMTTVDVAQMKYHCTGVMACKQCGYASFHLFFLLGYDPIKKAGQLVDWLPALEETGIEVDNTPTKPITSRICATCAHWSGRANWIIENVRYDPKECAPCKHNPSVTTFGYEACNCWEPSLNVKNFKLFLKMNS